MNNTIYRWILVATMALGFVTVSCGDDDGSEFEAVDAGADLGADAPATTGTVEVSGIYDGTLPDGADLRVSLFECPLSMPPSFYFIGTVDPTSRAVSAAQTGVEPGTWCLMAYVDMDPTDGLAPVVGVDPTNSTGEENNEGTLEIEVVAGQTTEVDLSFAVRSK